ncbi:hypothetical protein C9374_007035 [Naegleria lovaniensis]|uniref:Rho GTPase activating protein n=1 Tax=Naegleria lovaniensis TaxID=51637 RepID=A0AA88KSB3_NAELO|nr:uncharacterized protein C9374_007035 [Naegleria lovaniensis]KAG2393504.1 hypothetical protein C9374_007035 [Naegleria lovaniensis]
MKKLFSGGGKKTTTSGNTPSNTSISSSTSDLSSSGNNIVQGGGTNSPPGQTPTISEPRDTIVTGTSGTIKDVVALMSSSTPSVIQTNNVNASSSSNSNGSSTTVGGTAPSANLYHNISNVVNSPLKFEQRVEAKVQEVEATHIHYKACQNGFKGLLNESTELGRTEELMGQQLVNFSHKLQQGDIHARHLKVLAEQFGESFKIFSSARNILNRVVEEKYLKELSEVQSDNKLQEAKENNFLEAETDYQKQLRNIKYFLSLLEMKDAFVEYYENCNKALKAMEKHIDTAIKQQFENGVFSFSAPTSHVNNSNNALTPKSNQIFTQFTLEHIISQNMPSRSDETTLFGVELKEVLRRFGEPFGVPKKIKQLIDYIENNYLESEGLFRVPGHTKGMEDMAEKLNTSETVDLDHVELVNKPHTLCGVLKKYARELPQPLLTFELYDDFIAIAKSVATNNEQKQKQKQELKALVNKLPVENYNLLGRLCQLFRKIALNEEKTKMNASNISRSFGTNLMRTKVQDDQRMLVDLEKINLVCELLVQHADDLFPGDLDSRQAQGKRLTEDEIEEWRRVKSGVAKNGTIPSVSSIDTHNNHLGETDVDTDESSVPSPRLPLKRTQSQTAASKFSSGNDTPGDHSGGGTPLGASLLSKRSFTMKANENVEVQSNSSQRQSLKGWIEVLDKTRGKFYYFNPATGETSWKHPTHNKKKGVTKDESGKLTVVDSRDSVWNRDSTDEAHMDSVKLIMNCSGKVEQGNLPEIIDFLKQNILSSHLEAAERISDILSAPPFSWTISEPNHSQNTLTKEQLELFNTKLQVLSKNYL